MGEVQLSGFRISFFPQLPRGQVPGCGGEEPAVIHSLFPIADAVLLGPVGKDVGDQQEGILREEIHAGLAHIVFDTFCLVLDTFCHGPFFQLENGSVFRFTVRFPSSSSARRSGSMMVHPINAASA